MKKLSLFSAAAVAALMFPMAGLAQQAAPAEPQAQARSARPRLTDAQREAMRKLHEEQREASETTRRELRELNVELSKALSAATIDTGRVNDLKTRIAQKQADVAAARIEHRARVAALLTPEQRQAMGDRVGRAMERGPRGMRGARGARGAAMRRDAERGIMRGMMRRDQRDDARLRERIRRLEAQIEELRKKIG